MRENNSGFKFINPILDCEDYNANTSVIIIYSELNNLINNLIKKYNLQTASVYYRDLNNGPWYGYNEKGYFAPASLMKLPIMISLLKYAEDNPVILEKKVIIEQKDVDKVLEQNIKPKKSVQVGTSYSMLDLVNYMIRESDNVAFSAVIENFPEQQYTNETFQQVGVDAKIENSQLVLRTKDYAGFFRVLYNASYLNKDNSELALKILSESSFNNGLVARLPKDIIVAHKFGERDFEGNGLNLDLVTQGGVKQMHDCGIVYYPQKPYILCVMTRGTDLKNQANFIADISSFIYEKISK